MKSRDFRTATLNFKFIFVVSSLVVLFVFQGCCNKEPRTGDLNIRNVFFHCPRGQASEIQGSIAGAGGGSCWIFLGGLCSLPLSSLLVGVCCALAVDTALPSLPPSSHGLLLCTCVCIASYKDTSHIASEPTLSSMASSSLDFIGKDLVYR